MVFVDDIIVIYDIEYEEIIALTIMATLYAVGVPMAWHKTIVGASNLWVGFLLRVNIPEFCLTEEKTQLVDNVLKSWQEGAFSTQRQIHETVARTQWATATCPTGPHAFYARIS